MKLLIIFLLYLNNVYSESSIKCTEIGPKWDRIDECITDYAVCYMVTGTSNKPSSISCIPKEKK